LPLRKVEAMQAHHEECGERIPNWALETHQWHRPSRSVSRYHPSIRYQTHDSRHAYWSNIRGVWTCTCLWWNSYGWCMEACKRYVLQGEWLMPIGLVVFGDKSHMDLHGAPSLTPIIFTLTIFNRKARNNPNFWRPIAYPTFSMERQNQTGPTQPTKYKMNMFVWLTPCCTNRVDSMRLFVGKKCMWRFGFISS